MIKSLYSNRALRAQWTALHNSNGKTYAFKATFDRSQKEDALAAAKKLREEEVIATSPVEMKSRGQWVFTVSGVENMKKLMAMETFPDALRQSAILLGLAESRGKKTKESLPISSPDEISPEAARNLVDAARWEGAEIQSKIILVAEIDDLQQARRLAEYLHKQGLISQQTLQAVREQAESREDGAPIRIPILSAKADEFVRQFPEAGQPAARRWQNQVERPVSPIGDGFPRRGA